MKELEGFKTKSLVEEAKAETVRECFSLIFRNSQVMKRVTSSVPVSEPHTDSTGCTYTNTYSYKTDEEITEEEK